MATIEKALQIAALAHEGQKDKDGRLMQGRWWEWLFGGGPLVGCGQRSATHQEPAACVVGCASLTTPYQSIHHQLPHMSRHAAANAAPGTP